MLAAASLRESFTAIGEQLEERSPGLSVRFSFAASSEVAQQVLAGAPADVIATASPEPLQPVLDAGAATDPAVVARNRLQVAVPAHDPAGVASLADLARPEVAVALCQPQVPCGALARRVLAEAGVAVTPVTEEPDVRAALTKVVLGEVDAALVYATDVRAAGDDVRGVEVPAGLDATTAYPVALVPDGPSPEGGRAFVDAVLSPEGQQVLADAGFAPP
ncbi:molybdate ABC transporter substrate-binding protein [Quadrisphaera sp. DSM 44207]|uniref:molybdate ABC transporter substrate-binding protein n=1 Tax=Quadrisphaera sp. DSM 44207 TaxID=1881057 RepID=UPI00088F0E09|nr:molybdate ABC transporter substrate-binding protein [Quadrisphaera sp. DSM 44207]SDQ42869.1 molybdate transport system substrate-binding protein [Quadrisphaera sp. DSM 44207]